jgi:dimethylglycine dehydrogenase
LIEKSELTRGLTWHTAVQATFYTQNPFFNRIKNLSFDTFDQAEEDSGEPVGLHKCGSARVAQTEEELL